MRTIRKYEIPFNPVEVNVQLPVNSKILDVEFQNSKLFCWVEVKFEEERKIQFETVTFWIFGAEWEIPEDAVIEHVKTLHYDWCVWHIYKNEK